MKKINYLVLIFLASVLTSGCQSFNFDNSIDKIESSLPYLKKSSNFITKSIFSYAVSEKDRQNKAKIVYSLAEGIEEITQNGELSIESVAKVIEKYLPNKSHWDDLATNLILMYADIYGSTKDFEENKRNEILLKALNNIAAGCKSAAKVYITD